MKKQNNILYNIVVFTPMLGAFAVIIKYLYDAGIFDLDFLDFMMFYAIGILLCYLCITIHIIIHEAGHLIFGLKEGYGFVSYRIGPFAFVQNDGKIEMKTYTLAGTAGQCLMSPPEMVNGEIPVSLYNWGGVLINSIVSAIGIMMAFVLPEKSLLRAAFGVFSLIGIYVAFQNGIPHIVGNVPNDGYNAEHLKDDPKAMKAFYNSLKINELLNKGIHLKDMDDSLFELPDQKDWSNPLLFSGAVSYSSRLIDQKDFSEAKKLLKKLLEKKEELVGIYRYMVIADFITLDALEKGKNADLSYFQDKKFVAFYRKMIKNSSILRTEYAINRLVNNNDEMSEKTLKSFNKLKKNYLVAAEWESDAEIIDIIQRKAN